MMVNKNASSTINEVDDDYADKLHARRRRKSMLTSFRQDESVLGTRRLRLHALSARGVVENFSGITTDLESFRISARAPAWVCHFTAGSSTLMRGRAVALPTARVPTG
jgi:hypothetical protein